MITDAEFVEYVQSIDVMETTIPPEIHMRGILVALRIILRCDEGSSILTRAATVIRRADRLANKYPEFGPI